MPVHVFKNDEKLKWENDSSHSTFCVPYNHIRPTSYDDELKDHDLAKGGDLKKMTSGSMFAPYVDCAVLIVYPTINHRS